MQIIASATLTLASVTVAVVSAWFSYRNNFGWTPVVRLKSYKDTPSKSSKFEYIATEFDFEIWNRRKNAINIRQIYLRFSDIKIEDVDGSWDWNKDGPFPDTISQKELHAVIEPASSKTYTASIRHEPLSMEISVLIEVDYYDPRYNTVLRIRYPTKIM